MIEGQEYNESMTEYVRYFIVMRISLLESTKGYGTAMWLDRYVKKMLCL